MNHPMYCAARKPQQQAHHTAYQVDFVAVNCGKIVKSSKRKIRFRYGYSDPQALDDGKTGQDCRGSEHEILVIWSISSGKQAIAFDGREVFFDIGEASQTKLTHTWKDKTGHIIQVKIHAAPMSTKMNPDPDWKQYDLLIDGVSFFRMPKIYEIGVYPKEDVSSDTRFYQPPLNCAQPPTVESTLHAQLQSSPAQVPMEVDEAPKEEVFDLLSFDDLEAARVNNQTAAPAPTRHDFAVQGTNPFVAVTSASPQAYANPFDATNAQVAESAPDKFVVAAPMVASDPFSAPAQPVANVTNITPNTSPTSSAATSNASQDFVYQATSPPPAMPMQQLQQPKAPIPVTPPETAMTLAPMNNPTPTEFDSSKATNGLVDLDNLFGLSASAASTKPIHQASVNTTNAHKSLVELKGDRDGNAPCANKQPVMNPFSAGSMYNQPQYQQGV